MEWIRDLPIFFTVSVGICTLIVALSGAAAAIVKFYRWIRKPADDTNAELEEYKAVAAAEHERLQKAIAVNQKAIENINAKMEHEHDTIFTILGRDKERLDRYEDNFRVLYKGIWALLDNQISPKDGNEQMKRVRDELQSHIIDN